MQYPGTVEQNNGGIYVGKIDEVAPDVETGTEAAESITMGMRKRVIFSGCIIWESTVCGPEVLVVHTMGEGR